MLQRGQQDTVRTLPRGAMRAELDAISDAEFRAMRLRMLELDRAG